MLSSISQDIKIIDLTAELIGKGLIRNLKSFLLTYTGINIIYKIINKNDIIHYIDPAIAPLNNINTGIITIHDNPSLVLNTDLYMNSYIMKMHYKTNIKRFSKFKNVITPPITLKNHLKNMDLRVK